MLLEQKSLYVMFGFCSLIVLLTLASNSQSTPVKPFSDFKPNEHCPSWQLFNNECLDRYYEVSCYCDAQCNNNASCANSIRLEDQEFNNTKVDNGLLTEQDGNLVSNNSICCRNPFTCKQKCMPLLLHEACPDAPADWSMSDCPDGIIVSGCSSDKDCPPKRICCLRHDECAYGCLLQTRQVDPWY